MTRFSECFLLVFAQLAAGGMIGLTLPPSSVVERGFYKSSAAVFLTAALAFLAGRIALGLRPEATPNPLELVTWAAFALTLSVYLASMWGKSGRLRARSFTASLVLALVALTVSSAGYRIGPALGAAALLYPLGFVLSALVLGAVATGMLLGHWYLIDVGLSIVPLKRLATYYMGVLVLQLAVLLLTLATLAVSVGPGRDAVLLLWEQHRALLAMRVGLGPVAALAIGVLIHRTLAIPQTMAATGLFYIATLAVLVGEMLGRLILFRTSLPL
ncbi:MAG: hypothetical protein U0807_15765 [Candidatus Binatia bacterium]